MSSERACTDPYRRCGSLRIAIMTMLSRSPRSSRFSFCGVPAPRDVTTLWESSSPPVTTVLGLPGSCFADHAVDLQLAAGLQLVRAPSRQQLVQDHAQRIDVAGSRERVAPDLFGARVRGSHHVHPGRRRRRLERQGVRVQELGDPEVQQLGSSVGGHQDVGRLEVPVDHQVLVGVLHGRADRPEERGAAPGC